MSRINTNVQSLIAQRVLGQNNELLNQSLERLSTGLRINRGKDDPAGLIASENLQSELTSLNAAIDNSERADQVVNIAEGGLQEVSNLLTELQGLVTTSANTGGLSQAEREANQLQIDSILQTIDRISSSTSFQGIRLLNGNFDFETTGVVSGVTSFQINSAKFNGASQDVNVTITQSAQQGSLFLSLGSAALDLGAGNGEGSTFVIEIAGSLGSRELQFSSGTSITDIVAAINTVSDVTGVTATSAATGLVLRSTEYGSDEFVSVRIADDGNAQGTGIGIFSFDADDTNVATGINAASRVAFDSASNPIRDSGQDVGGTINGVTATGDGLTLNVNTDFLDTSITLSDDANRTLNALELGGATAFTITGGGADFQLAGQVDIGGRVSLGISDVATRKLGRADIGFLDDLGNGRSLNVVNATPQDFTNAQRVISAAIENVSTTRGRLGAFQRNIVGATVRSLGVAIENTAAANSVIRDADFAAETAELTRSQILSAAATNTLAQANNTPQSVLQLLG